MATPKEIVDADLQSKEALEDVASSRLLLEEAIPQEDASLPSGDAGSLQKAMREMRGRYEASRAQFPIWSYLTCRRFVDRP